MLCPLGGKVMLGVRAALSLSALAGVTGDFEVVWETVRCGSDLACMPVEPRLRRFPEYVMTG